VTKRGPKKSLLRQEEEVEEVFTTLWVLKQQFSVKKFKKVEEIFDHHSKDKAKYVDVNG